MFQRVCEKEAAALRRAASVLRQRSDETGEAASGIGAGERQQPPNDRSPLARAEADFLERIARICDGIRPFSARAAGIAILSVAIASAIRFGAGRALADPDFAIYLAGILATGLLAGMPAAIGAAVASLLLVVWIYVPPYFAFAFPRPTDQLVLGFNALSAALTIYFAHCCRVVLRRMRERESANRLLLQELDHRGRNLFTITQVIVRKSLGRESERAAELIDRLRAVQSANELLIGAKGRPIALSKLVAMEFGPYGESRLLQSGPEIEIRPESARHLLLVFHELVTNAAKYGALSRQAGKVHMHWAWNGGRRLNLTWTESGGPPVTQPSKDGFGSQLIRCCVKSLSGTVEQTFLPDGLRCSMTLRLTD